MAKSPADRYQSAAEMLRDLAKVREGLSLATASQAIPDVGGATTFTLSGPPRSGEQAEQAPPRSSKTTVAALGEPSATTTTGAPRPSGRSWTWLKAGMVAGGLFLGGGLGWAARPVDLLSKNAPEPSGPPALWLAPEWRGLAKRAGAEQQYRHAQLNTAADAREAAWLAVPGHFPTSREWASRAYGQLARLLLRRRDADRLDSLANEIEGWERGQGREAELVALARAGVKALRGELGGVLDDFDGKIKPSRMTDTALIELALEVTLQAERVASQPGAPTNLALVRQRLREVQFELIPLFLLTELRNPGFGRPLKPGRPDAPKAAGTGLTPIERP
jgi:serine/threonine-protein kinase